MPQIGHAPGPSATTSGSIGQIHFEDEEEEEEEREDCLEGEEGDGSAGNAGNPIPGGGAMRSAVAPLFSFEENLSGSLLNFSAQLFAQKYQSLSPQ
jgi:hypothetical protein